MKFLIPLIFSSLTVCGQVSNLTSYALWFNVNVIPLTTMDATQMVSGSFSASRLPVGVPTTSTSLIGTNFPTGTVVSNSFGHVIEISANAVLTEAAVAGRSQLSLECVGVKTNRTGQLTIIAGLTGAITNGIQIKVPVAGNYIFRDTSAGIGNSAVASDGQIAVFP